MYDEFAQLHFSESLARIKVYVVEWSDLPALGSPVYYSTELTVVQTKEPNGINSQMGHEKFPRGRLEKQ